MPPGRFPLRDALGAPHALPSRVEPRLEPQVADQGGRPHPRKAFFQEEPPCFVDPSLAGLSLGDTTRIGPAQVRSIYWILIDVVVLIRRAPNYWVWAREATNPGYIGAHAHRDHAAVSKLGASFVRSEPAEAACAC